MANTALHKRGSKTPFKNGVTARYVKAAVVRFAVATREHLRTSSCYLGAIVLYEASE
jgi:hypothetical protein